MPKFSNNPSLNQSGEQSIKRFVHQPLTVNHNGFKFTVHTNGKTTISGPPKPIAGTDDVEYDEITIPASLVFKISQALQMTREVKYLAMSEVKANPELSAPAEDH